MGNRRGSVSPPLVLRPRVPLDIGARLQRQRILDAMAESCAERAFAGVTIADVVARARTSRATFYKHFGDKRECFEAAVNHFVERIGAAIGEACADADPWPDRLRRAAGAVLRELAAEPAYAKLLVIDAVAVDPALIDRRWRMLIDVLGMGQEGMRPDSRTTAALRTAFGRAQVLVANELVAGRAAQLPELAPEVVFVALLPLLGAKEALKQAKLAR